jgi:hypothetical protein
LSAQNVAVYHRCHAVVDELLEEKRYEAAEGVLRALSAYLDVMPAYADGSDRHETEEKLANVVGALRASKGLHHGI